MKARTVGLLHGGALGDFVLTWHVLRAAGRAVGTDHFKVWARGSVVETGPQVWGLDSLNDIEACGLHGLFAEGGEAPEGLGRGLAACQLVVNCMSDRETVPTRNLGRIVDGAVLCVDPRPDPSSDEHITAQWCVQLREQGINAKSVGASRLSLGKDTVSVAWQRLHALTGEGRIGLVHPGSGGRDKCWPLERFVELARSFCRLDMSAVFVTGPVEAEIFTADEYRQLHDWPTIENSTVAELIGLCAAADVCIGNDSGFSHVAAAAGARTVTVFGATEPGVWAPAGEKVLAVGEFGQWPDVEQVLNAVAD